MRSTESIEILAVWIVAFHALTQAETLPPLRLPDIISLSPSAADASSDGLSLKIGFLGLGTMGASIVNALLQAGLNVTVWNRTPSKVFSSFSHFIVFPKCYFHLWKLMFCSLNGCRVTAVAYVFTNVVILWLGLLRYELVSWNWFLLLAGWYGQ